MRVYLLAIEGFHVPSAIADSLVVAAESALVVAREVRYRYTGRDEWLSTVHLRLSCFPTVDAGFFLSELFVFAVGRDALLLGFQKQRLPAGDIAAVVDV